MPEGDTVHLLARRLDRALLGNRVERSDFRVPQLATRDLAGRTIEGHDTHGKHLFTRFSDGVTLHSHLLMDGEWKLSRTGKRLPRALMYMVRLVLHTTRGGQDSDAASRDSGPGAEQVTAYGLRLHELELLRTGTEHRRVGHLGPDPLRGDWDAAEAIARLSDRPDRPLVSALLDQRNLAGLGNLWANELAFLTGVSPWTPVGEIDVARLVERAATMLQHSAYVPGAYQVTTGSSRRGETHWVTGRQRSGCLRCGGPVSMVEEIPNDPGNRRTWWCPACQPGPQLRPG